MKPRTTTLPCLLVLGTCTAFSFARTILPLSDVTKSPLRTVDDVTKPLAKSEDDVRCDVVGCHFDQNLFCLSNGVVVMGSCSLKELLCTNGVRNPLTLATSWTTCIERDQSLAKPMEDVVVVFDNRAKAKDTSEDKAKVTGSEGHPGFESDKVKDSQSKTSSDDGVSVQTIQHKVITDPQQKVPAVPPAPSKKDATRQEAGEHDTQDKQDANGKPVGGALLEDELFNLI